MTSTSLSRDFHPFTSQLGQHLLVVDGSQVFDLDSLSAQQLQQWLTTETLTEEIQAFRDSFLMSGGEVHITDKPLEPPPLRSLSLNVAQSCNLGCHYCYADEGKFGGHAQLMTPEVAEQGVERLITEAEPGVDLVVGFMGGEPLLNRPLIHHITHYASQRGKQTGHKIKFSLTTNATLIKPEDAALFASYGFNISVSIDGPQKLHDRLRPTAKGKGSYEAMLRGLEQLKQQRPGHLSARITVTPQTGKLSTILRHVLSLGFDDAGFAPVLVSPNPNYAFKAQHFQQFLAEMIECGRLCQEHLLNGQRFPFTNFETALNEIHRGSHRPYPCGAGAAYLSLNSQGKLYACHRLVDQEKWALGSVQQGSNYQARQELLKQAHVNSIEPCRGCWARYLCGGGCYHEVNQRGRIACDYIRGWLEFCLTAYAELSAARPEYFIHPETYLNQGVDES
ncbi:MAG: radical SAM protein [Crocosphaera sp.]